MNRRKTKAVPHESRWPWRAAGHSARSTKSARCVRWKKRWQGLDLRPPGPLRRRLRRRFHRAGLANGMTPREPVRGFLHRERRPASEVFDPSWLMVPAYDEFARRGIMLPGLALTALWRPLLGDRKSLTHALERLGPACPPAFFRTSEVHAHLARAVRPERPHQRFPPAQDPADPGGHQPGHRRGRALRPNPAGTTSRSPRRCRPVRRCPACFRRSRSTTSTSWTAR